MTNERPGVGGAVRERVASLLEMPRREAMALVALALLALCGAGYAYVRARPLPPLPAAVVAEPSPSGPAAEVVTVHVVGAVRRPGVYELVKGARVRDAVSEAGGLASTADPAAINLARPVSDGEQIWVPARGGASAAGGSGGGGSDGARGGGRPADSGGKVNINLASEGEFESLPGIGPVLAERIVQYRTDNGPFASVRDLMKVPGIGQKKFASLEPHLTV